jgi:DUF1365 family protein
VNSTFGESHNYWLTTSNQRPSGRAKRYATAKALHVSPFMGMQLEYDWIFTPPGDHLVAHMNTLAGGKAFFDATLRVEHRSWTRHELHRALLLYPFMTLRVIGAIHWEALKLWLKQVPVCTHPAKAGAIQAEPSAAEAAASKGNLAG